MMLAISEEYFITDARHGAISQDDGTVDTIAASGACPFLWAQPFIKRAEDDHNGEGSTIIKQAMP